MTEGPLGGAAFNNEFGRPALTGYFRTYEEKVNSHNGEELRGYHKPIMLAGGIGNIRADHVQKGEIVGREADRPWRPGDEYRPRRRRGIVNGFRPV